MARVRVHVCCGVDLMEVFPKILSEVVTKDIKMKELVEIRSVDIRSASMLEVSSATELLKSRSIKSRWFLFHLCTIQTCFYCTAFILVRLCFRKLAGSQWFGNNYWGCRRYRGMPASLQQSKMDTQHLCW